MSHVDQLILDKTDLDLNTSGALPQGKSNQGATAGSLGDASMSDLEKGYVAGNAFDPEAADFCGDGLQDTKRKPDITASPLNGFLDRPQGWQR